MIIYYIMGVTKDLLKQEIRTMKKNALQALAVFAFLVIAVGGDIATSLL